MSPKLAGPARGFRARKRAWRSTGSILATLKIGDGRSSPGRRISGYMTDGQGQGPLARSGRVGRDRSADRPDQLTLSPGRDRGLAAAGRLRRARRRGHSSRWRSKARAIRSMSLKKLNGREALYRMALDGSNDADAGRAESTRSISTVSFASAGARRSSATPIADDDRRGRLFRPRIREACGAARARPFPNQPLIDFVDASDDGNKLLIFAGVDTQSRHLLFPRPEDQEDEPNCRRPAGAGRARR